VGRGKGRGEGQKRGSVVAFSCSLCDKPEGKRKKSAAGERESGGNEGREGGNKRGREGGKTRQEHTSSSASLREGTVAAITSSTAPTISSTRRALKSSSLGYKPAFLPCEGKGGGEGEREGRVCEEPAISSTRRA